MILDVQVFLDSVATLVEIVRSEDSRVILIP